MNPRDDVILSHSDIASEQTRSGQLCPSCKGGRGGERTLSVGKTGPWLWWRCHRASCGFVGKSRVNGYDGPTTTDEKRNRYRNFKRTNLPLKLKHQLAERFNISPETFDHARWSYTPDYDGHGPRVIMPIIGPTGSVRGENFRSYWGNEPKSIINGELGENAICWYKFRKYSKTLVIVEDQPSALRVAESGYADSLALLGTTLTIERIAEIREGEYNKVWLALDNDATTRAIKYLQEFRSHLPTLKLKALDEDIKDQSPQQFQLFLQSL